MTIKNAMTERDPSAVKPGTPPADEKTSQILDDIAQTRAEMSGTLGELSEKLSPSTLKEKAAEKLEDAKQAVKAEAIQAKEAVREATIGRVEEAVSDVQETFVEGSRSLMEFVKANPIPLALTGVGLTWLLLGSRRDRDRDYYPYRRMRAGRSIDPYDEEDVYFEERRPASGSMPRRVTRRVQRGVAEAGHAMQDAGHAMQNKAEQVADSAGQLARHAQDSVRSATRTAGDRAERFADDVRARARRTGTRIQQTYRNNPLVVGAAVTVAGTALGLSLPLTQREQELLGSAREELMREAQGVARGALDKVQEATKRMGGDGE